MSFNAKRRINFFDCDPAGIMFYGHAFNLIHSVYEEMIASLEITNYWVNKDYFVPIIHCESDYLKPARAGETAEIEVVVSSLREHSFELSYTCWAAGDILFKSRTVHVFINREFSKIKIPDEVAGKLKVFQT